MKAKINQYVRLNVEFDRSDDKMPPLREGTPGIILGFKMDPNYVQVRFIGEHETETLHLTWIRPAVLTGAEFVNQMFRPTFVFNMARGLIGGTSGPAKSAPQRMAFAQQQIDDLVLARAEWIKQERAK